MLIYLGICAIVRLTNTNYTKKHERRFKMTDEFLEDLDGVENREAEGRVVSMTTNEKFDMNGNPKGDYKRGAKWNLFPQIENCFSC